MLLGFLELVISTRRGGQTPGNPFNVGPCVTRLRPISLYETIKETSLVSQHLACNRGKENIHPVRGSIPKKNLDGPGMGQTPAATHSLNSAQ